MSEPFPLAADAVALPFAPARPKAPARGPRRRPSRAAVLGVVFLGHLALLWAVQAEFRHPRVDAVEPEAILTELVAPPSAAPKAEPEPPKPAPPKAAPTPLPTPLPTHAPPGPPALAPTAALAAPAADASPSPQVRPPSADADYASCRVAYPPMSRSLREQGQVVLEVLVGADGRSRRVALVRSSGSRRLDAAAAEAMRRCRFRPGTVNGEPREMAYEAPVDFVLR
jgi:protein TonB